MKWIIAVLILTGAAGIIGGITNVQRWSSGATTAIVHYTPAGRWFAFATGISSAIAAYTCIKKKKVGWWMVSAMIVGLMLTTAWGIVCVVATDVPLAVYWLAQIVLMLFLLRWWLRQKKVFTSSEKRA